MIGDYKAIAPSNSGITGLAPASNINGQQILQNHTDQTLNRVGTQGAAAIGQLQNMYSPGALQVRQQQAVGNVNQGLQGANNLQDSAQEQYGVQLTEAQMKAQQRLRGLRGASARAAASNNMADRHFEERLAAISQMADMGRAAENQALQGIQAATNTQAQVAAQNRQLREGRNASVGGLIGTGVGMMLGGPAGAMVGSRAGSAIF